MLSDWLDTRLPVPAAEGVEALRRAYAGDYPIEVAVERAGAVEWRRTRLLRMVEGRGAHVVLVVPRAADGTMLLQEGAEMLVFTGLRDRGIGFVSTVGRRGMEEDDQGAMQPAVRVDLPSGFYGIQRRMFVRIRPPRLLPCTVQMTGADGRVYLDASIDNISRGGASIRLSAAGRILGVALRASDVVAVSVALGAESVEPTKLSAVVLRAVEPRDKEGPPLIAVQWHSPTPDDQRVLADFVIAQERQMLRRRRDPTGSGSSPRKRRQRHPHVRPDIPPGNLP